MRLRPRSITWRIALLIVGCNLVVAIGAAALEIAKRYRDGLDALETSFRMVEISHVPALRANVWHLDRQQLERQLQGIEALPGVVHASVSGDLPWSEARDQAAAPARRDNTRVRTFDLRAPDDTADGETIGKLTVVASLDGLYRDLQAAVATTIAVELVRMSLLVLILFVGIRLIVIRRLERITRFASKMNIDNLDEGVCDAQDMHGRRDDITVLAEAIDRTRADLKEQIARRKEIEEQRQELAVQKQAAELANRSKSEFLANMSHEIRTPMNAVIGMTQLALSGPLRDKERNYVDKAHRSAHLLLRILNDILDYSRVEAGRLAIECVEFDLHEVLTDLADLLGVQVDERGLELIFDTQANLPRVVLGDPLRLRQVLLNLCSNALKFTERGDIRVIVRFQRREGDKPMIRFAVSDTGPGIPADRVAAMFDSFTQADSSTARRFGGTGLGLAISRSLVTLMGGSLEVESEVGRGSTFTFAIPMDVGQHADGWRQGLSVPPKGSRFLVVDDSEASRDVIAAMLRQFGFQVELAIDGRSAVALVRARAGGPQAFDIVILDWRMPAMDGVSCARELAQSPARAPAVLMVTAYGRDDMLVEMRRQGVTANAVLVKPVMPSALLDACRNALERTVPVPVNKDAQDIFRRYRAQLSGKRVLLAEDNEVNLEMTVALLERVGIVPIVARDGAEALQRLRAESVDAVLMDCHMPGVDGISATRAVRSEPRWADLPIIAMTASAMAEDRDMILAAGMNDHVAKPVNLEIFYATLVRWTDAPQPSGDRAQPHDELLLDVAAGLEHAMDDASLYRRVLERFDASCRGLLTEAREAAHVHDFRKAARLAHTLRSNSAAIGAAGLARALLDLELALDRDSTLGRASAGFDDLEAALQRVQDHIRLHLRGVAGDDA